jgi:hypothetical protein
MFYHVSLTSEPIAFVLSKVFFINQVFANEEMVPKIIHSEKSLSLWAIELNQL